jgi:hypothetical protein
LYGRLGRRCSQDRRFDQHVIGAADHDEMFDVVAADQNELALPVEIENIGHGQSRLLPAAARQAVFRAQQNPTEQREENHDDDEYNDNRQQPDESDVAERIREDLQHSGRALSGIARLINRV